jgi:hypothetical protein
MEGSACPSLRQSKEAALGVTGVSGIAMVTGIIGIDCQARKGNDRSVCRAYYLMAMFGREEGLRCAFRISAPPAENPRSPLLGSRLRPPRNNRIGVANPNGTNARIGNGNTLDPTGSWSEKAPPRRRGFHVRGAINGRDGPVPLDSAPREP